MPMSDLPASATSDELLGDMARLRNAVSCELMAQLDLREGVINLADVAEVAYAVAVRLGHEFRLERAPIGQCDLEDDESLGLDGAAFYGSTMPRGSDQRVSERYPIFDHGWQGPCRHLER
jgi:hypothetical protein